MFTHYTATIKFADGNTRYSGLTGAKGLIAWAGRYGIKLATDVKTGEVATWVPFPADVAKFDVEPLTEADLAA